jgi:hypothetical protein
LLAHGWWFSPGTLASSTTKTGRHDIAEIGVKTPKNQKNQNQLIICDLLRTGYQVKYMQTTESDL